MYASLRATVAHGAGKGVREQRNRSGCSPHPSGGCVNEHPGCGVVRAPQGHKPCGPRPTGHAVRYSSIRQKLLRVYVRVAVSPATTSQGRCNCRRGTELDSSSKPCCVEQGQSEQMCRNSAPYSPRVVKRILSRQPFPLRAWRRRTTL